MLDKVQHLYLSPISFEEVPYESSVDLKSISIKQDDGSDKVFLETPIVNFSVTLGQADSSPYAAAQSILAGYRSAGLPGLYSVVQVGDQLSVVPKQVRASSGDMRDVAPVMSSPVEFPLATRGVVETLQLVTQSVSSQSGARVILLNVPFHLTDTVTMSATGEAARDVIVNLGKIFGVPLASQCLYDATDKTYYLNLAGVFPPNPAGVPPVRGLRIPLLRVGPPDTKVFTKQ